MPPSTSPAATDAPVPLDEPPVKQSVFHGLRAGGQGRSKLGAAEGEFVCRQLADDDRAGLRAAAPTENASALGTWSCMTLEWPVVGTPAVS